MNGGTESYLFLSSKVRIYRYQYQSQSQYQYQYQYQYQCYFVLHSFVHDQTIISQIPCYCFSPNVGPIVLFFWCWIQDAIPSPQVIRSTLFSLSSIFTSFSLDIYINIYLSNVNIVSFRFTGKIFADVATVTTFGASHFRFHTINNINYGFVSNYADVSKNIDSYLYRISPQQKAQTLLHSLYSSVLNKTKPT